MKNISIKTLVLCIVSFSAFADESMNVAQVDDTNTYLRSQGLPVPGDDVVIKSISKMPRIKMKFFKGEKQRKKFGFIKDSSTKAQYLSEIKFTAKKQFLNTHDMRNPAYTGLRKSVSDLKMAYNFVGVPSLDIKELVGFSPLNNMSEKGWVGASQIFVSKNVGTCSFSETNIKLSKSSIIIAKEELAEPINGKYSTVEVYQDKIHGYVYEVAWYDNQFFRTLECQDNKFDESIKANVIALANRIDSN